MQVKLQDKIDEYYTALVNRDEEYKGLFFVGVTTTSIFCISTCRARKPKKQHVEFYSTFSEALECGFRPCKICRPTENTYDAPEDILTIMNMLRKNPKHKISDHILREQDISPDFIRRWFKKNYGITFHAFQRMYRMNIAYTELKKGNKASDTAFNMGYESLSGFGYTYKKLVGSSPKEKDSESIILISRYVSPLGPMFIVSSEKGICLVEFTNRKMLETEFGDLQKRCQAVILTGENQYIKQLKREFDEYFSGKRQEFTVKLDPIGTEFQQGVWKSLQEIPYGKTSTYKALAQSINNPNAYRAVASANGYNKISIVIPCHRVIGSDGSLTGYGGGLERKKWLLNHEKSNKLGLLSTL